MIGDYEVVEYTNPYFPDREYYKVDVDGITYHHTDYGKLIDFVVDRIVNRDYYNELKELMDKGIISNYCK
jgi:hypothetical protein